MFGFVGLLRRAILAPSLREVSFYGRGFPGARPGASSGLEAVPQAVVCGFEWAIEHPDAWEVERRLELVAPEQRGFAFEGAAMAYTVLDSVRGTRTRDLLLGPGSRHIFLTYIGIGFAMARLPRVLWKKVVPDLGGAPYFPTMSWLAVDGYGFDLAYFHTGKYVDGQRRPKRYPWAGHPEYFDRAVDQGIGRALWFIHDGVVARVIEAVARFPRERQGDLWSGVGLAATFAGGCAVEQLPELVAAAGDFGPEVGLGAVFAFKARHYSGYLPEHCAAAASALTGLDPEHIVRLADGTEPDAGHVGPDPAYEVWRANIRSGLSAARSVSV